MPKNGPVAKMPTKDTRATMQPSYPERADPDQAPAKAQGQSDHSEE